MYDLNDMRVQHEEWTLRNFGEKHDGNWAIVGMIEETGELSRALLKQHQGIRGDHDKHEADAKDSVGDYVVFSMAVATVYGIDPNQVRMGAELARPYDTDQGILYGLAYHTGRIGRYHEEQRTVESVAPALGTCYKLLDLLCQRRGWDFDDTVEKTWNHVKTRDWKKDPESGGTAETDAQVHANTGGQGVAPAGIEGTLSDRGVYLGGSKNDPGL